MTRREWEAWAEASIEKRADELDKMLSDDDVTRAALARLFVRRAQRKGLSTLECALAFSEALR